MISTIGRGRRSAVNASRAPGSSFSFASSSLRAASHSSWVTISGRLMSTDSLLAKHANHPLDPAHARGRGLGALYRVDDRTLLVVAQPREEAQRPRLVFERVGQVARDGHHLRCSVEFDVEKGHRSSFLT